MNFNSLRITIRQAVRQKGTTIINLIGLATGIATALAILLFCQQEMSYDNYQVNADRTVRVARDWMGSDGGISIGFSSLAPRFTNYLRELPGVESGARLLLAGSAQFERDGKFYREEEFFLADPEIFDVFSIPIVQGESENLLTGINECVLSQSAAQRIFGEENPIGKTLLLYDKYPVTVKAVYKDVPRLSHLHYSVLMPMAFFKELSADYYEKMYLTDTFSDNITYTYLLLEPHTALAEMDSRIKQMLDTVIGGWESDSGEWIFASSRIVLKLQPIRTIHLESNQRNEVEARGNKKLIQLFLGVGVLILLIATINFVNLSTARAATRAREVGIRKVVGAEKRSLIGQFFTESTIMVFVGYLLAACILLVTHPWLEMLFGQPVQISLLGSSSFLPIAIGVFLFTALAAGFYPAMVLSAFPPATVLRGGTARSGGAGLRKLLVVFQFAISASLIIGILTVSSQMRFLLKQNLGYEKENLITVDVDNEVQEKWDSIRARLLELPGVAAVAVSKRVPSGILADAPGFTTEVNGVEYKGNVGVPHVRIGPDFIKTYGISMAAGRGFNRTLSSDSTEAYVLNEEAVRRLGWASPEEAIGAPFEAKGHNPGFIIGVVKDFNYETLRNDISPMVLYISKYSWNTATVRLAAGDPRPTIEQIKEVWAEYRPYEMRWEFLEDRLNSLYENETRMFRLLEVFSTLAVVIASLGLLGLASFAALKRSREIAIRKTFGAATADIVSLLSTDFVKLVLIGCAIGLLPTAFLLSSWLNGFAYRIPLQPWHFILAVLISLVVALTSVASRAFRAASANPAVTLRSE